MIAAVLAASLALGTEEVRIAVIPDTQAETFRQSAGRARWIAAGDFDAIAHVGDVTDWGARDWSQFRRAQRWFGLLPDVPTSVAAGNHDTGAVGVGGSAFDPPRTAELLRDARAFNRAALGSEPRRSWRGGRENSWQRIDRDWAVLTLEMWPRKGAVRWAQRVIDRHPRKRWVVITHMCLDRRGRISAGRGYGASSPRYLRDTLIRPNVAVRAVLCGHIGTTAVRRDRHAVWAQTNRTSPGRVRVLVLDGDRVRTFLAN